MASAWSPAALPSGEEQVLRGHLNSALDYFSTRTDAVPAFLKQGDSPPDPQLNTRELAAYASLASLLLNLDEAVTKE
jgi:hypothetical protein